MSLDEWFGNLLGKQDVSGDKVTVDAGWYHVALKHYCSPCNRWFGDTRGKLMHDRHRHKNNE